MAPPDKPVLFMKAPRTIAGTGQPIILPAGIGGVTYEAELAAVIGTRAENVSKDRALDHVAAYGCFNDISASEIIKADGHFDRGKNFATFGPFGPYPRLPRRGARSACAAVSLKVDGRTLQSGSTRDMLFGVADLDLLSVGAAAARARRHHRHRHAGRRRRDAQAAGMAQAGLTVEVEVEGLGRLINPIIEGPAADA